MEMKIYKDSTVPFTVFMEEIQQLSIERHYFIPKSIDSIRMYFLVYILLRDRFISFIFSIYLNDWEKLNHLQKRWFENKLKHYKIFKESFMNMVGKQFFSNFKIIIKRCELTVDEGEEKFKSVYEMTRHELIAEFEFFFGRKFEKTNETEIINGRDPKMKINLERDPDHWLDSIDLVPENKRLFNLGIKDSIKKDAEGTEYFGKERTNLMEWVGKNHLIIRLNSKWVIGMSMRLKKCQKIYFDIKTSKNVTLNDCLSKSKICFNFSLFSQRRISSRRKQVVLFQV